LEGVTSEMLRVVCPSNWLAAEARRSSLLGRFEVLVAPNGVDTELFAPRDKAFCRNLLGVPQDAVVLLFCAYHLHSQVKGLSYLTAALKRLREQTGAASERVVVALLGDGPPVGDMPVRSVQLRPTADERLLPLVFSAADIFVIPSLEDNLPNVVLESMACGVPAVGFRTGGIPDMIRPGVTGVLVDRGDVEALSEGIRGLIESPEMRARLSRQCRQIAESEYALEVQARHYDSIYRSAIQAATETRR
jgi:glycosyltransferase involved in cell wall biosynthesis